jgi:hypothetical protein
LKPLDISGLCLYIGNLCLDSPKNPEKSNLLLDNKDAVCNSNSSSDGIVADGNTVVIYQPEDLSGGLAGANACVFEDNEDYGCGVLENFETGDCVDKVESRESSSVLLEAAKTFDSGVSSLEDNLPPLYENDPSTAEIVKTDNIAVEFNQVVNQSHIDHQQAGTHNSDVQEQHLSVFDANSKTAESSADHDEALLHVSGTGPVETINLLESKSSDLDSTGKSTLLEVSTVEQEATSEFTETAVSNSKSGSEAEISLTSVEVPEIAGLVSALYPASFGNTGAVEYPVKVVNETPAVLSELFEICNRQQKDLELSDEKFVDGTEFFTSPSKFEYLGKKPELDIPHRSIQSEFKEGVLVQPVQDDITEFDQTIADEAEKILQEIINSSSEFNETGLIESDRRAGNIEDSNLLNSAENMADLRGASYGTATAMDENGVSPFASHASLHRSPPLSGRCSPRSTSQTTSPCESPRTKSKLASANAVRDGPSPRGLISDRSPNTGKNGSDLRVSSNKVIEVFSDSGIEQF